MRNATNGLHQEDASEVHTRVCISSVKGVADSAVSIISLIELEMGSIFLVFVLFTICYLFPFIFFSQS